MTLVRQTSGLLARHESQGSAAAQFPFVLADWVAPSDVTLSLFGTALRMRMSVGNQQRAIRRQGLAPRATALVQVTLRAETNFQVTGCELRGLTEESGFNAVLHQVAITAGSSGLRELIGGSDAGASLDAAVYGPGRDNTISLYTSGLSALARHWQSGRTYALALSREVAGDAALRLESFGSGADVSCVEFLYCADRYITVRAMPVGSIARVRRNDGVVVAQAAEAGRAAIVDLWGVMLDPVFRPLTTVEVAAADGTLIDTIVPTGGVWPGDVYAPLPWEADDDAPATAWAACASPAATPWADDDPSPATSWESC